MKPLLTIFIEISFIPRILFVALLLLIGCINRTERKTAVKTTLNGANETAENNSYADSLTAISKNMLQKNKRYGVYQFESFDLIFYGFKGYDHGRNGFFYDLMDPQSHYLNPTIRVVKSTTADAPYKEFALVLRDTVSIMENNHHDEYLFGDHQIVSKLDKYYDMLEHVTAQVIPKNKKDRFKLSVAYRYEFYEGNVNYSIKGISPYESLGDSSKTFYPLFPGNKYNESVRDEYRPPFFSYMVKKHGIRLVEESLEEVEYGPVKIIFSKEGHLLRYVCDQVILKIERLRDHKVMETKYIVVELDLRSGC